MREKCIVNTGYPGQVMLSFIIIIVPWVDPSDGLWVVDDVTGMVRDVRYTLIELGRWVTECEVSTVSLRTKSLVSVNYKTPRKAEKRLNLISFAIPAKMCGLSAADDDSEEKLQDVVRILVQIVRRTASLDQSLDGLTCLVFCQGEYFLGIDLALHSSLSCRHDGFLPEWHVSLLIIIQKYRRISCPTLWSFRALNRALSYSYSCIAYLRSLMAKFAQLLRKATPSSLLYRSMR
ncbi:hypothetical protein GOBAR_DD28835 [Gossypium barbadense]|nr:hypothetical protein GOBAR_DD28835 [Gossypium barbadense]